jgi:YfiH family protein
MSEPVYLTSQRLLAAGFVHGFFTRIGGCSRSNFESLNCSFSVGDNPDHVSENLARIERALDLAPNHLVTVTQVHGSVVEGFDSNSAVSDFQAREADAVFGRCGAFGLAVRTADCVPILVGCTKTGWAAAIHAGWRGLVSGIIPRTIESMVRQGCPPQTLVACIGPHIGADAFEVSEEVATRLDSIAPHAGATRRVVGSKPHVSLRLIAEAQLLASGLGAASIEALNVCTYSNKRDFFSFRRDGTPGGRQLSVIRPRDE